MIKIIELAKKKLERVQKINIIKAIFLIVGVCLVIESTSLIAQAGIMDAIGSPDAFQKLGGDAKYLSSSYRDNYYLDTVSLGITQVYCQAVKFLSNFFWSGCVILTYLTILAFHFSFSMDLANMFSGVMEVILRGIKINVFDKYWELALAIGFVFVATAYAKNNIVKVFKRLSYMIVAFCLAATVCNYATPIVTEMTSISKGIGASSIVSISSGGNVASDPKSQSEQEISKISAQLWINLVHKPWLDLEGDNKLTPEQVEKILSLPSKSDERQKYIDDINKQDKKLFEDTAGEDRIFPAFIILVINVIKMVILFFISLIQIAFQIFTILLVFALPFILLLSIVPAFGGAGLLQIIGEQLLSTQIGIVLTAFLLGIIIELDSLIGDLFKSSPQYGWFFASFMQSMLFVALVWQRKQIFDIISRVQRKFGSTGTGVWHGAQKAGDSLVAKGNQRLGLGGTENGASSPSNLKDWASDKVAKGAHNAANGIMAVDGKLRNLSQKIKNGKATDSNSDVQEENSKGESVKNNSIQNGKNPHLRVVNSDGSDAEENIKDSNNNNSYLKVVDPSNSSSTDNIQNKMSEKQQAHKDELNQLKKKVVLGDRIRNGISKNDGIKDEVAVSGIEKASDRKTQQGELELARSRKEQAEKLAYKEVEGNSLCREDIVEKTKNIKDMSDFVGKDAADHEEKVLSTGHDTKSDFNVEEKEKIKDIYVREDDGESKIKALNREERVEKNHNKENNNLIEKKVLKSNNGNSNVIKDKQMENNGSSESTQFKRADLSEARRESQFQREKMESKSENESNEKIRNTNDRIINRDNKNIGDVVNQTKSIIREPEQRKDKKSIDITQQQRMNMFSRKFKK